MKAIFKRELRALFTSFRTYLFLALTLAAGSACGWLNNLSTTNPQFCENAQYLGLVMAACVPLLTAPTYASDRKNHVERLLCSLPIRPVSLAMGRFLACLAPVAISCALTLLILVGALAAACLFFLLVCMIQAAMHKPLFYEKLPRTRVFSTVKKNK